MKLFVKFIIFFVLQASTTSGYADLVWEKRNTGLNEFCIKRIAIDPVNPNMIFVGTAKALYHSTDGGVHYALVPGLAYDSMKINDIFISSQPGRDVFIATNNGAFQKVPMSNTWEKIYDAQNESRREVFCVRRIGQVVYLGTGEGLLYREEGQSTWQKKEGEVGRIPVYRLVEDPEYVYAITGKALYRLEKNQGVSMEIFRVTSLVDSSDETVTEGDPAPVVLRDVFAVGDEQPQIFLVSQRGILKSHDHGTSWSTLAVNGLPIEDINSLAVCLSATNFSGNSGSPTNPLSSGPGLFAGTTRGIFYFNNRHWQAEYRGLEQGNVDHLVCYGKKIYAATDKGVFYSALKDSVSPNDSPGMEKDKAASGPVSSRPSFVHEPTVSQVQFWAVHYADVSPEKIQSWTRRANVKAIIPKLSVGLDREASNLYHWDTGSSPDVIAKGRQYVGWDVSLLWDLSDLVWNNDLTSIDSRAKLTSELREDILSQVTRIYFERRRLQMEIAKSTFADPTQMDYDLRIQELTALLDGFTGSQFSRRIRKGADESLIDSRERSSTE